MADYIPDSAYYADRIKEQEKLRDKLEKASYDSANRGYVVDGKVYTSEELSQQMADINQKITELKRDERTYGKYGPEFGSTVKSNDAGIQYEQLRKAAVDIEITDYASAVENLKAWKAVNDFVAANPDIKVAKKVNVLVKNDKGRNVRKSEITAVPIDVEKDSRELSVANQIAVEYAEKDTTKTERIRTYGKPGASNATYKNVKKVTDQATLDARLAEIDSVSAGQTVTTGTQATARGQIAQQPKVGGQSAMTEAETMAAGAGFQKMGKKPKQPSVPGAPGTGGGGRIGGGPAVPPSKVSNWESKFREMFPGSSWMLDIDRTKYPDVFKIFQDAVTNRAWESEAGSMRFKAQLDNSSFMKELKSTNKVAQIKSLVGDLGFDTLPFNSFVTKAMNFGWDDVTLKQEAYKEVFRKDDAGNYANPTSVTRAKASNDYLRIANIGKAYFNNLSDDTIEKALVGGLTTEDVERQQREVAKTKYSHLGNLIDQGVTLKELSSSFQSQAAQLLERDPNSIDMSTADFEQAFNFGEEGKKRMMTSGEWEIKLRSDPRFNWDKTQNAKQEAMSLATTIAQAFGKVI